MRSSSEGLQALVSPLRSSCRSAAQRSQSRIGAVRTAADGKNLNLLVYSAGIQHYGAVLMTRVEPYDMVQSVNVC